MSDQNNQIVLNLSDEEQHAIEDLQREMDLENPAAVMRMLLRQAQQRAAVVCPSCGHFARQTREDAATCNDCMSVLHLSEGIWQVIHLQ